MKTILSLQPETRHIGYAVFEGNELIDWGTKNLASAGLLDRTDRKAIPFLRALVERHEPDVLVLPTATKISTTARNRFLRAIRYEVLDHPYAVATFNRQDIQECFTSLLNSQKANKQSIMQTLVKWFPELQGSLPKPRRPWESQDYWVPMFDAVALVITWLYHNE